MPSVAPQCDQQGDVGAPMAPGQATTYADAKATRGAVLATLTTRERTSLWRWCIGITVLYAGLAALLAVDALVDSHRATLFAAIGLASFMSSIGGFAFGAICGAILFRVGSPSSRCASDS